MKESVQQQQESRTTGIDDSGIFQHGQHVGRARQCVTTLSACCLQSADKIGTRCNSSNSTFGCFANHREDGSFDGLQHCFVGSGCGFHQCLRKCGGIYAICMGLDGGRQTTKNLTENHTTISASTHERPMADCFTGRGKIGGGGLQFGDHGIQRAPHVGSGVTVGHGVHVQTIDGRPVSLHGVAEGNDRAPELICPKNLRPSHGSEATYPWVLTRNNAKYPPIPPSGRLGSLQSRW